jgi:hypothetical protein
MTKASPVIRALRSALESVATPPAQATKILHRFEETIAQTHGGETVHHYALTTPRHLKAERNSRIRALAATRMPQSQIAAEVGVSLRTVKYVLAEGNSRP